MVVIMKPGTSQNEIRKLAAKFEAENLKVGITNGVGCSILGLVGDTAHIDIDKILLNEYVERVMRVSEPYKKANRKFHPEDTIVDVNGVKVGGGNFAVMAGPSKAPARLCSEAVHSNPALLPTPSKVWASKV